MRDDRLIGLGAALLAMAAASGLRQRRQCQRAADNKSVGEVKDYKFLYNLHLKKKILKRSEQ